MPFRCRQCPTDCYSERRGGRSLKTHDSLQTHDSFTSFNSHAMNDAATQPVPAAPQPAGDVRRGTRHKWFPIVLLALALVGWLRRGGPAAGFNVYFLCFGLGLVFLVSLWFLVFGWPRRRVRASLVLPLWLVMVGLMVLFRPINDGSLTIVGWQPRFASSQGIEKQGVAEDLQTTPNDYPRLPGHGPLGGSDGCAAGHRLADASAAGSLAMKSVPAGLPLPWWATTPSRKNSAATWRWCPAIAWTTASWCGPRVIRRNSRPTTSKVAWAASARGLRRRFTTAA